MKKFLLVLLVVVLGGASMALAADVGFGFNLHIGNPSPAPIIVDEPPLFLAPPALGFQVAVDVPYDMFRIEGRYYLCKDHVWFVAPGYDGPWSGIRRDHLPARLARRRYADIISLRDEEYGHYKRDGDHYQGKPFRPGRAKKKRHGRGKNKRHHH